SSRRRHTRFSRDWSSDVCSSDLLREAWEMWRIDSSLEADRQWGDKWDVVNEAESSMLDKTLREDSRMLDARMYLDESGKMSRERSEERRVGKECRAGRRAEDERK